MKKIKITLSRKILVIFLTCILLPILLITIYFYGNIRQIFHERAKDSLEYSVDMVAGHVEKLVSDAEEIAISVGIGENLQGALQEEYESYEEFYGFYNSPATTFLREITTATQGIDSVVVYTDNPTIFNSSIYANFSEEPQVSEWVHNLKNTTDSMCVISRLEYENGIYGSDILRPQMLICYRIPAASQEYPYEMAICIQLEMNKIYEWLRGKEDNIHYYLVNEKSEIIASTNQKYESVNMKKFQTFDEIEDATGEIRHSISFGGRLTGWRLIGVAKEKSLMADLKRITVISASMIIFMLILSGGILISLIRPYSSRLAILSKRMEDFSTEDLSPVVTKPYHDEVEIVIQNYNQMMSEMDVLINEVYALNLQKKELELDQIQIQMNQLISQVNPHFLFNTLNAILTISEKNQYTEVNWCIEHLALMMRKLLDWSRDKVAIQEEIEFVQMYLDIEKLRFADQFDFEIDVDAAAEFCLIPKMSIQPLVENACKYGIHKNTGHGKVTVRVKMKEGLLQVHVLDTGAMLTQDEIEKIKEDFSEENGDIGNGVGLKNIFSRLKLYYGNKAELIVDRLENKNCFGFIIHMEEK